MPDVLRIRDWDEHYERSDTRKCRRAQWVPVPNKWDGKGFKRLMRHRNREALFGAWILILEVASRCPTRGLLVDADGPLTAKDIADKTDSRESIIAEAIEVLSAPAVGWIIKEICPEASRSFPKLPESSGLQDRTGQDNTREIPYGISCSEPQAASEPDERGSQPTECAGVASPEAARGILVFPCVGKGPREWSLTEAKLAEYSTSFPGVDCLAECRKARQWCIDNPPKRKTFGGMPKFLSSWLSRVQDAGGAARGNDRFGGQAGRGTGDNAARVRSDFAGDFAEVRRRAAAEGTA